MISTNTAELDFAKYNNQLMPCIVQDANTDEILMQAFVNPEALENTIKTGNATFWSRSRNELWEKGLTSGDTLRIIKILTDCDKDCLLYKVKMIGAGACHKPGWTSCFGYKLNIND